MVKNVAQYPWSSYPAMIGAVPAPPWLHTDWLLQQFGKSRAVTRRKYAQSVSEGVKQASLWENVSGQVLLGSADFVENLRVQIQEKGDLTEVPIAQRMAHRPDLAAILNERVRSNKSSRDAAIKKAYLEYRHSMAAIARELGLHYSTVSKVIQGVR